MKWTWNKPEKRGNYWYRRICESETGQKKEPRILYVNSDLCVPQVNLYEYREPVSVNEYNGQWAGPINEPEEKDNLQDNHEKGEKDITISREEKIFNH